MFYMASESK